MRNIEKPRIFFPMGKSFNSQSFSKLLLKYNPTYQFRLTY